ncbi:putative non-specific serine/threonine protein kinase [Helianthus annuus]|nr:putative non-specific serine/threonine protein kinase [Helianthus annuus]
MEIFEGKKMTDVTLTGVSSISQPNLEETVVTTTVESVVETVVETTEVSVVKMVQEDKEDEVMKNVEKGEGGEGMEKVNEGLFGNLVGGGDDEGVNVNGNENGASMAMDVEVSLFGEEDAGGENLVSEGNVCVEKASGDPMEICLSAEKQKNNENGNRIFGGENVENREDNGDKLVENKGEHEEEEEDHGFAVGDFVWGKIKSHPWWPGQIYNPSDASDNAARLKRKGRILVAHFGDGSFSWCSPSQLKPFIDHFPEMSKQSDSKKFVNAVQMALEEVSRLVEAGLTCKCQTVNRVDHAGVVNKGIKEGVPVPKGNMIKVLMDRIEPVELLSILKDFATMDPGAGLAELELALLKSLLNVFYSKKGGYLLVKYHDPMCIDGLEYEPETGVVADSEMNGPSESIDNGDNKLYQKRKQKSVADLMKEDEPKDKKAKTPKDGGSSKRKRKALMVSVTPETDHENGGGGGVEEETMSPRQRKKSKYLSPPYLSPVGGGRLSVFGSGSGSFKEPKPESEPEKVAEMPAKPFEDSLKKSSGKKTRQNKGVREGSDSQEEPKTKSTTGAAVNVKKVLHGLLRVALDPTSFTEKNLPAVTDFVSSYRSSIFKEGSSHQTDQSILNEGSSHQTDQKKKARGTSDVAFIKEKLESMMEIVQGCAETEMSADVKASLEGEIQEVLQKVGKLKGK